MRTRPALTHVSPLDMLAWGRGPQPQTLPGEPHQIFRCPVGETRNSAPRSNGMFGSGRIQSCWKGPGRRDRNPTESPWKSDCPNLTSCGELVFLADLCDTVEGRNPFRTTLKPWETVVRWYLQGILMPWLLRWCRILSIHSIRGYPFMRK